MVGSWLKVPKEPIDIKETIRRVRKICGGKRNIKYDSLAVWSFNRLPAYLWEAWREELTSAGYTWQRFLQILRFHTNDMVMWALAGNLSWEDLIKRIIYTLKHYKRRLGGRI